MFSEPRFLGRAIEGTVHTGAVVTDGGFNRASGLESLHPAFLPDAGVMIATFKQFIDGIWVAIQNVQLSPNLISLTNYVVGAGHITPS